MKDFLCIGCGWQGKPRVITKGNIATELILWLFFLLPGLCYSVWRHASRYKGCPVCGAANPIPGDSPVARQFIARMQEETAPKKKAPPRRDPAQGGEERKVYVIK